MLKYQKEQNINSAFIFSEKGEKGVKYTKKLVIIK